MAKRAVLPPEMRKGVHSIHVPDGLWNKFIKCFSGAAGDSASAQVTQWIETFLDEQGKNPEETKAFNYEQRVQEKTQVLKKEWEQKTLLEKERIPYGSESISVYEAIWSFSVKLIRPKSESGLLSIEEVQELRQKIIGYEMNGSEQFNRSQRLIFVHYLDYVLKRRTLEKGIEEYLQNNNNKPLPIHLSG